MTLDGKTAFVSGSGHNIGRAIVLEFAGRGANVVVNGLTDPESAEKVADEARSLGVGLRHIFTRRKPELERLSVHRSTSGAR